MPVRATGELPDASRAAWSDARRCWPATGTTTTATVDGPSRRSPNCVTTSIAFTCRRTDLADRDSWGEWHYFNVLSDDASRWAFISFIVGGDVTGGEWGGQLLVTLHEAGKPARRFSSSASSDRVRFSTTDADLRIGGASVRVREDGAYLVTARVHEEVRGGPLDIDLTILPAANADFPGASLQSGPFTSGYVVPALRASATGAICESGARGGSWGCPQFSSARAYHDHNWGVWRGVTWEWGAARAGAIALLYGRVEPPDTLQSDAPLFVYVTDSLGFVSLFRPRSVIYEDGRTTVVNGRTIRVPSRGLLEDARGEDSLRVELLIDDAVATDTRQGLIDHGESEQARDLRRPYFVQMQGRVRISMRVRGVRYEVSGTGFFETYR